MANLIQPLIGMIGVTAGVWSVMYVRRLRYISKHNIDPDSINTPEKANATLPDYINHPSNNFKNLFELPVIFYALCLGAQVAINQLNQINPNDSMIDTAQGVAGLYWLAWGYVILRGLHSVVQCTYNKVMHRFTLYFLSSLLLWWMTIKVAMLAWMI